MNETPETIETVFQRAVAAGRSDPHRAVAAWLFNIDEGTVTADQRLVAKTIAFAVAHDTSGSLPPVAEILRGLEAAMPLTSNRGGGSVFTDWTCTFPGKMGLSWKRAWNGSGTRAEAEAIANRNCNVVAVPLQLFEKMKEHERRLVEAERLLQEYRRPKATGE